MAYSPDPAQALASNAMSERRTLISGNALGTSAMLFWAAGFPAAEVLLQNWPPLVVIVARLALAMAVMIPLWIWLDGPAKVRSAPWGKALFVGGIGFGFGTYFLLVAQDLTDPVTVALVASCGPLVGALLEVRARTRRLTWSFCLGIGISILGGIIATNALAPAQLGLGAAFAVAATVLFTWASMATVREFPKLGRIGQTTITMTGALVMNSALLIGSVSLGFVPSISTLPFDFELGGMLAIYAVISLCISQAMYIGSIGKLGVAVASVHMNIAPFYVMVIMMVLGAAWNWSQAVGAMIVALGVVLSQYKRASKARSAPLTE
jgi:drug/metabolite transporter (DMT)-like permease